MLLRYCSNLSQVISAGEIELQPNLSYGEEPIKILALEIKELRNKRIALVKVLWQRHGLRKLHGREHYEIVIPKLILW